MTVEPIRNKQKINQMYFYLKGRDPKYGLLFKFGINTGLRISDILPIQLDDIFIAPNKFHEHLIIREKKTKKEKKIKINGVLKKEIISYLKARKCADSPYLFYSNKGGHISRVQAYRVLKEAANICEVENFGTHSLRKTWGYWTYKKSKYNIGLIMETFNHSSQKITLRYIGISQDQKDELYSLVQL
jgi:integrase